MKQALLVIDVQQGLFDATPRPFEADAVISRINQLSSQARAAHVPVIFIHHESPGSLLEFDTPAWQLERGLIASEGDLHVRKRTPDSFLRTELESILRTLDIQELVICGYATEFCVDTTTRRALALGYPVILVSDAHTTHDKPHADGGQIRAHHNATLSSIASFGPRARPLPTSEMIFTSRHP